MSDMRPVIEARSDQLNADDLVGGPRTIHITKVTVASAGEQRVTVYFEGDNGKPWKPCKSMCRILVEAWGPDSSVYAGKRVTLFRNPKVTFGGIATGGIQVSHVSHVERDFMTSITVTRGKKAPYQVKLLETAAPVAAPKQAQASATKEPPAKVTVKANAIMAELRTCETLEAVTDVLQRNEEALAYLRKNYPLLLDSITIEAGAARVAIEMGGTDERQPGDDDL